MIDILINTEINAKHELVFQWLTKQEFFALWLTPAVIALPKKGTIAAFALSNDINFKVEILELIENKEIIWKCIDGNVNWIGREISFKLKESENKTTLLEFRFSGLEQTADIEKWTNNWRFYLETLKDIIQQ